MKIYRNPLVIMAILAMSFPIYGVNPGENPAPGTGSDPYLPIYKRQYPRDPNRKRIPSKSEALYVSLIDGVLTVEFPSDAEMGTVTIGTGDFTVFCASIDSANPSVQLPTLSGSFILSIAFDNGDEYEGEIEI